jgi:hypothetical protein
VGPGPAESASSSPVPLTEDELKQQLLAVPELFLQEVGEVRAHQLYYAKNRSSGTARETRRDPYDEALIAREVVQLRLRARAAGLPVIGDDASTIGPKAAETLGRGAADLHWSTNSSTNCGPATAPPTLMTAHLNREPSGQVSSLDPKTGKTLLRAPGLPRSVLRPVGELRRLFEVTWAGENVETKFDVVPVLVQVLQVENEDYRRVLVEELARIPGPEATSALVNRALYDTSANLRRAAREALKERPALQFRDLALKGFEYPWAPVATHAAQLLIETNDVRAVPGLVRLLDQRAPERPYWDDRAKRQSVRELVRINHLHNCCLCHPPSYSGKDWAAGRIVEPGVKIPEEYSGSQERSSGPTSPSSDPISPQCNRWRTLNHGRRCSATTISFGRAPRPRRRLPGTRSGPSGQKTRGGRPC